MPEQKHIDQDISEFTVANSIKNKVLSIPVNPTLSFEDVTFIANVITNFMRC
jgi:dTDP-4-amino-4,6-dideoxygalactose transaminase